MTFVNVILARFVSEWAVVCVPPAPPPHRHGEELYLLALNGAAVADLHLT